MDKPKDYEHDLGEYGAKIFDGYCGEPIMWGFEIKTHLNEKDFEALRNFGRLECVYPRWFLITKTLTKDEAIKKYGKITDIEVGVRGGWKSITFGNKKFINRIFK